MAYIVQMYRGPTSLVSIYTGPVGQIVYDTTGKFLRLQDGVTPGGIITLMAQNNLSELSDKAVARENLALGTAAEKDISFFDVSGAAAAVFASSLQKDQNLSDLDDLVTARANLGVEIGVDVQAYNNFLQALSDTVFSTQIVLQRNAAGNLGGLSYGTFGATMLAIDTAANARTALGLGTAAVQNTGAFDAAGAATAAQAAAIATASGDATTKANAAQAAAIAAAAADATTKANAAAATAQGTSLQKAADLSDLHSIPTAVINLGFKQLNGVGAIASGSFAHGLGSVPSQMDAYLTCTTIDLLYQVGDVVRCPETNDTTTNRGVALWGTTTLMGVSVGSGGISLIPKGGGAAAAITFARWTLTLVAKTF